MKTETQTKILQRIEPKPNVTELNETKNCNRNKANQRKLSENQTANEKNRRRMVIVTVLYSFQLVCFISVRLSFSSTLLLMLLLFDVVDIAIMVFVAIAVIFISACMPLLQSDEQPIPFRFHILPARRRFT